MDCFDFTSSGLLLRILAAQRMRQISTSCFCSWRLIRAADSPPTRAAARNRIRVQTRDQRHINTPLPRNFCLSTFSARVHNPSANLPQLRHRLFKGFTWRAHHKGPPGYCVTGGGHTGHDQNPQPRQGPGRSSGWTHVHGKSGFISGQRASDHILARVLAHTHGRRHARDNSR